jgi:hypothetical protein
MDQTTDRFNDMEDKLKLSDKNLTSSLNSHKSKDNVSNLPLQNSNEIIDEIKDLSDKIDDIEIKNDQTLSQMERRLRYNIEKASKSGNSSAIFSSM